MEHLIYRLEDDRYYLSNIEREEMTTDESEALIFSTKDEALSVISGLNGTTDFWGTRPPRPH